jgi:hypothetical protein
MKAALTTAALLLAFVALGGFLFGQVFFGLFSLPSSIAGLGGLLTACGAFGLAGGAAWAPRLALWSGVVTVMGVVLDAGQYYLYAAIPGNYYAWAMVGPFAACAAFVSLVAARRRKADSG